MFYKIISRPARTFQSCQKSQSSAMSPVSAKSGRSPVLSISSKSQMAGLYKDGSVISLFAGKNVKKVTINITDGLENDTMAVSDEVLRDLYLPQGMACQILCTQKRIRIGPVVGLLMFAKKSSITSAALKRLLDYALLYNSIKGLLYVFSADSIDFETNSVEGFCYNDLEHSWNKGIFPFPDAIYRRASIPKKILYRIQNSVNNRMYNSSHFNKFDFWNMASSSPCTSEHLPMTRIYKSIHDIDKMFEKYKVLFLKPVNGTKAHGLMRITKNDTVYSIQEKMAEKPVYFTSREEVSRYIETFRKGKKYLVQEGVDLLKFDNRYIDFRVVMQKDHLLEWQCTGIIACIGKPGGVCSNYAAGKCMPFETFFHMHFTYSNEEIFQKKQEIITLCKKTCGILNVKGKNYADLGIDVGLDKNLKPWIFEINNRRHEHRLLLLINDHDAYYRAKANPVLYGVKLSGFEVW